MSHAPTTSTFKIPAHVAGKVMDDELVVINLKSGLYYASPGVGARIWQMLELGSSVERISAHLAHSYDRDIAEITADVGRFITLLVERDLIVAAEDSPGAVDGTALIGQDNVAPYAPPSLQAFDDMAQAFAIDPPLGVG